MQHPGRPFAKLLVVYFGLIEIAHSIALAQAAVRLALTGTIPFPAPPPPGGWSAQVRPFLISMGALDAANVVLALAFVYGYFAGARWRWCVGAVSLTVATYSAVLYAFGAVFSGAWAHNAAAYWSVAVAYSPVAVLTILYVIWAARGQLHSSVTEKR
jgi:hypothetical protein